MTIEEIEYPGPLSIPACGFGFQFLHFPLFKSQKIDDGTWVSETRGTEVLEVPGLGLRETWKISVIGVHDQQWTAVGTYWILPGWGIVQSSLNAHGWDLFSKVLERSVTATPLSIPLR